MKRLVTTLLILLLVPASNAAWAANEQAQTLHDATAVLNDFVSIPENAIPQALLSEAYGIAVIPSVIKAGFVIGGRYGEGVMSVRTADGTWSHPVFIDLAGASLGWQIGAASSDLILVFKTERGVEEIINGQVTLGADVSIAAGPVGRTASAATNLQMDAEIYSYSRSRGLFAGLALEGGVITIDAEANWRYYGEMVDSRTILHRSNRQQLPQEAQRFIYTLDKYMPPLNTSYGAMPYENSKAGTQRAQQRQPTASTGAAGGATSGYGQQSNGGGAYYGPVYKGKTSQQRGAEPAYGASTGGMYNGQAGAGANY